MDLNHEPTDYESVALTKLSYAPTEHLKLGQKYPVLNAYYSIASETFTRIKKKKGGSNRPALHALLKK